MKEIKSYFKDVSTLREFESKAQRLLRQKDLIAAHLKESDEFKDLLAHISSYPSSYVYFNKGKMVKHYCPVCGHKETVEHRVFMNHTCKEEDIDKSKGDGFKDISWGNNNHQQSFSFSPFGYSDAIMTVTIRFMRVLDEDYASLDESDFVILEKATFDVDIVIGNDVIGYSDKHKLRLLNSNNRISDNLSILDKGYLRNNTIRYEHLGGVDFIRRKFDPDMINYVYTRKLDDNQISIIEDVEIPNSKFVRAMYLRGSFDKKLKSKNRKKRTIPTRNFAINYDKVFDIIEKNAFFYIQKKYSINNKTTYDVYCNKCGDVFELSYNSFESEYNVPIKCSCGLEVDSLYHAYKEGSDFVLFVSDVVDGQYVQIVSIVKPFISNDLDECCGNTKTKSLIEYELSIVKLTVVENGSEGLEINNYRPIKDGYYSKNELGNSFVSYNKSDTSISWYYKESVKQGGYVLMDSIIDNAKNSNIKYSGYDILIEHVFKSIINDEKTISSINSYIDISNEDSYLKYWVENPKIERYIKNPLLFETLYSSTAKHLFSPSRGNLSISSDPKSKNILNIRKDAYSYINDIYKNKDDEAFINLSLLESIHALDYAYSEDDRHLHKEEIKELLSALKFQFKDRNIDDIDLFKTVVNAGDNTYEYLYNDVSNMINNIVEIFNNNNISYKQIANYCTHVFYNQCIKPKETLQIWKDYLYMIKYLDYNSDDKYTIFPRSLKKEHDIASFSFDVIKDEQKEKIFKDNMMYFMDLSYSDGKLSIVLPEETSDIVREGARLNHCVASYVLKVSSVRAVLFVRKNEDLDTPYYTIEIDKDAIVQVSGFSNKQPTAEINHFLKKFAKEKNLKCMY